MNSEEPIESFNGGWVKLFRSIIGKGWYRDSEYVHLWVHLLLKANHKDNEWFYKGQNFKVKRGQFITSRQTLVQETGINRSKLERILNCFEIEQQIEQQNLYTSRLISIVNYEKYQNIEQQVSSKRAASEQRVSTNKEYNNVRRKESTSPNGLIGNAADYLKINKSIGEISKFIKTYRPRYGEPYFDLWNLFAAKYGCAKLQTLSESRKKQIKIRSGEPQFDLSEILRKASEQKYALESSWFTFDFLIKNDTNYLKVLEGKYLSKQVEQKNEPQNTLPNPQTED